MKIAILNAYGSTVGDNLEHQMLAYHLREQGHDLIHFWNFNRQQPFMVKRADALIVGPAGIIWYGSPKRDLFFLSVMKMAKRAVGVSVGYNMDKSLTVEWMKALRKLEFISSRGRYTYEMLRGLTCHPIYNLSCLAWLYKPVLVANEGKHDLGTILNVNANRINYKTANPFDFNGLDWLDIPFAEPMEKALKPPLHNVEKHAATACNHIQKCEAILAGRLHGFILSLKSHVPAIVWKDGMKIDSQAAMCQYPWVYSLEELQDLDAEGWLDLIQKVKQDNLKQYVEPMIKLAALHYTYLDEWLTSV